MAERRLDVSGLEPPEPLVLTLAEADALQPGDYLRMLHRREPCLLFERLAQRGFDYETRCGRQTACEVFIWRAEDRAAAAAARHQAQQLPPWRG